MDPADRWPGPWTAQTQLADGCLWVEVGTVNYRAKTVQLLMKDTRVGVQRALTGHLGEVIALGRFTVRIDPPNRTHSTAASFEVDIYWL